MKNPFVKDDNTVLIAAIALGTIAAGALTYLFLTNSGADVRKKLKRKIKNKAKDTASGVISKKTKIPKKAVRAAADLAVD